jgi:hypothetical protein
MTVKRPELERAKARRWATRRAIQLIRETLATRKGPVLVDGPTGERAVVVAARILDGRCKRTGEDPAAVLDELERDV